MCIRDSFNEGRMDTVAYAHIGKYSENVYWDKASGLLDQMACAVGGLITIDFMEPASPVVEKIDFDFSSQNHSLIIVNTGKGHADLSADYSSVPIEMKKVAEFFGKEVCAQITEEEVIEHLAEVRAYAGDRSVLRALHFFEENKRVEAEVKALKEGRFTDFLMNITASGNSSWKWLQNCFTNSAYQEQGITVALALTELFIAEKQRGACRVHGGGFAGVIMAMLPNDLVDEYVAYICLLYTSPHQVKYVAVFTTAGILESASEIYKVFLRYHDLKVMKDTYFCNGKRVYDGKIKEETMLFAEKVMDQASIMNHSIMD